MTYHHVNLNLRYAWSFTPFCDKKLIFILIYFQVFHVVWTLKETKTYGSFENFKVFIRHIPVCVIAYELTVPQY